MDRMVWGGRGEKENDYTTKRVERRVNKLREGRINGEIKRARKSAHAIRGWREQGK